MGSLIESSSSLEMAIAPDAARPVEQLKTPDNAPPSRELRPIAIHGIERFIDAGKAAEFVQLNRKTLLSLRGKDPFRRIPWPAPSVASGDS